VKYSQVQLKAMALVVLAAEVEGDERAFIFWMQVSMQTGISPDEGRTRAIWYAQQ